jgi:uncharacterized damage-inducible protein DinB
MTEHLIQEFEQEVKSTRKLLEAVPEKDINYKPSPISWTMGELAQHIATIYYWYAGTLTQMFMICLQIILNAALPMILKLRLYFLKAM